MTFTQELQQRTMPGNLYYDSEPMADKTVGMILEKVLLHSGTTVAIVSETKMRAEEVHARFAGALRASPVRILMQGETVGCIRFINDSQVLFLCKGDAIQGDTFDLAVRL